MAADVTAEVGAAVFSALFCPWQNPRSASDLECSPDGSSPPPPPPPPLPGFCNASPGAGHPGSLIPGCGRWAQAWPVPAGDVLGLDPTVSSRVSADALRAAADAVEAGAFRTLAGGRRRGVVPSGGRRPVQGFGEGLVPDDEHVDSSGWAPGAAGADQDELDSSADPTPHPVPAPGGFLEFHDGAPVDARLLAAKGEVSPAGSPASRRVLQPVSAGGTYSNSGSGSGAGSPRRSPLGLRRGVAVEAPGAPNPVGVPRACILCSQVG